MTPDSTDTVTPDLRPKTFEEHRRYLHEMVRLKLWFLWNWLRRHPEEPFVQGLRDRVDIYRKTDINDDLMNPRALHFDRPAWLDLEQRALVLYVQRRDDPDASRFEAEAFEVFRPSVDARARRDYTERPYVLDYQCGSLRYDPPRPENPRRVFIHIANAVAPRSIFDDPRYLPRCLRDVMEKSTAQCGADSLGTHTWLNSYPRWLAHFAPEWLAHMEPATADVRWHFGYWGQFMTARGTFHERRAALLRSTDEFPYWPRYSWCSFAALEQHLRKLGVE